MSPLNSRYSRSGCAMRAVNKRLTPPDLSGFETAMVNEIFAKPALCRDTDHGLRGVVDKMMRKSFASAALAMALLLGGVGTSGPAGADNKDGFDAWYRGDYARAVAEWRPAANAGDADAQFNLGQAYTLGRGVPVDVAVAEGWFRKAALQGHLQAQAKYGLVLFDEGKRSEAAPWLDKAVHWGEPRAELVLGTMLFNGDGVAKDWPRAYALIVRAAAAGTPRASEVQAQMDTYIPVDQRQSGLLLARQYEAEAQRPQLPPEIAGQGSVAALQGTDLPPSSYDPSVGSQPALTAPGKPAKPRVIATASPVTRPPAVANAPTPVPLRNVGGGGGGGWRVQLGAFGDPNNARKLWSQVGARFPGHEPIYLKTGALTRVLVGGYGSGAEAGRACGSVRPCVPVGP